MNLNPMLQLIKLIWNNREDIIAVFNVAKEIVLDVYSLFKDKDSTSREHEFNKRLDDYLFETKKAELKDHEKNLIRELAVKDIKQNES